MKNKLLVLLVAIITGFGIVRAESIDLLDSTVTVNESSVFGHSKTVYQYNSKGSLIRQTRIYATWSKWKVGVPMIMNRKAVFVYDDEGHEIDLYYSSLDTATGKWTDDHRYLYDEWHNRTYSVGKWNADSTALLSGVRYFYDSNHFLIGNESFDTWNGVEVVTDKYFYTNDANGYKISMYGQFRPDSAYDGDYKSDPDKFNQSGWKNVDSAYYERNAAGQSIRETFFRWDESNNQWLKDGYQDFTYDAQGHLLTDTVFARDFETNIITYNNMTVREYDSYGNLTRTTTYSPVVSESETQWQVNDVSVNEYTYNEKGLISLKHSHTDYNDGAEPNYSTTTYYYSHYDLDENGNIVPEPCLIASGTCGDNLTWELSCDSVLTISGSGAMTSAPWIKSYKTAIKNAIIEDGVTNIYGYAFYYCSNLESVTIGNGVTQIEEYAFYKCTALESVQLPKNIQSIGNYAYAYCSSLTSIVLPNSVTTMGDEVFCMCTSLASASLSENLTKISMGTFDGCTALSSIIVPEGVQMIEARAFYQCKSLVSIEIPSTVTFIDGVAFSLPISFETALKTFTCHAILPPSLGNNVFEYLEPGANLIRLYVPGASLEAYKAADQWKEFEIILPIPGTEPCESDNTIRTISACSGYWFNDEWLEQSGIYHDTLLNHLGCDSIIELHLTIHSSYGGGVPSDLIDTITIVKGDPVIISNGITIYPTETGYQNDTMRTIYGCDSIVTHYIIVTEPKFPVIFLDYNSNVLSEQNVEYNQAAKAPEVPAREGYTFAGWNVDIEHIVAPTYAIALYDKIGGNVTYLSEEGDVIATENVDLHLPAAPIIAGKSFKGWLTESADSESGIVFRATYTSDNPTTHDDVTITPSSNSAAVIFPFITGALSYQLVIRDLFGNVVCKIMFSATGHLLGIAFAPSRNRESQQATQTTGFNFTVEGLDANTTYEYEFVANDDTDEVIETLSGSFTTKAENPTDNEQVNSPSAVRKYLEDGHLMIDANSHIFDTQGKIIK